MSSLRTKVRCAVVARLWETLQDGRRLAEEKVIDNAA